MDVKINLIFLAIATWALLGWGRSASEKWALDIFTSTKDVGIYSALYQVGYMPIIIFQYVVIIR